VKLSTRDVEMFSKLGIGPELLQLARIERVDDAEARSRFGLTGSSAMDFSGVVFPYFDPITNRRHTARVRRDRPEIENGQPKKKYLCPYGDRRHLYLLPGTGELVKDSTVPLLLVEAEKSVLALTAWAQRLGRRILLAGLGGAWGWRGRIGKKQTADGDHVDEVGPLPELLTLCRPSRKVVVLLDSNARTNVAVQAARTSLARTIAKQKSLVYIAELPSGDGINGPDDLVGSRGDAELARVLDSARPFSSAEPDKYSDDALANSFSDRHEDLRYTAAWGQWHIWKSVVWEGDTTLHVYDLARELCRETSLTLEKSPALARALSDASTIAAVERLARADRRHAAVVGQWDADPWMLNTPGGIVDLRSDQTRTACPTDYCTKVTAVAPTDECTAPVWLSFLDRVTAGDRELQAFLRRVAGYCLTGFTREDVLFFAFGPGRNGKTVFLNTLASIWADYAKYAPTEMFLVSNTDRHPTDLARLQGARLVTAAELESGKRWAESRIKSLTGGDTICARFMRGDFFEYTPQFKLIFAANHKPRLRAVDEAIRSRFLLLPFTVTIPPEERDKNLPEKLRVEWPAILRWAIDGCLAWQREGLNPPAAVTRATQEYFVSEDTLGRWLDERCLLGPQFETSSSALFGSFREWAEKVGEMAWSQRAFSQNLLDRGFANHHMRNGWFFKGLALKTDAPTDSL